MKQIKFRVWDGMMFLHPEISGEPWKIYEDGAAYEIKINHPSYKIQQFTGFKDKNGQDIYDGDIVEWQIFYDGHKAAVKFIGKVKQEEDYSNGWAIHSQNHRTFLSDAKKIKILGNIFETPELCAK